MKNEERTIKVSLLTGITEIVIAVILQMTGWHEWYWANFHVFGLFGMASLVWAFWHSILYRKDTGKRIKW